MKVRRVCFTFVPLWFAVLCPAVLAQQETGSITGQIVDPTGAAVTNVQITIKNESTAGSFSTVSDAAGFYRAPQLTPGTYTITATAPGFSTLLRQGIVVRVNDRLRIDLNLQVGAVSEQITVEAATPLLQTEDSTTGQVVDNQRITELPLNGRNWLQLATLAPATVTYPGVVDGGSGNSQALIMNLGGTRTTQNNYLLDGADNSIFVSSGTAVVYPPVDSIQEFKVQTNNYTADTGRMAGAVINATIKSGANAFHGTAYEFLRNRELNARNFFAAPTQQKPQFTRNQFGASIGGPFLRNKLLFFLNYEGNRQRQDQTATRQVFTTAQKAGDFSSQLGGQAGVDALGRPVLRGQIFDPLSLRRLPNGAAIRDPFLNNIIPASQINPVSKKLIDLVPLPNAAGSPNFVRSLSDPLNIDTFVGRIDWVRSEKNTVFSHFVHADQHTFTEPILGLPLDGGNAQNFRNSNQRQFVLGWTHVLSSANLNEFRMAYLRNSTSRISVQGNEDVNAKFGIPFPFQGGPAGGLATMTIAGFTNLGTTGFVPFLQIVNKYELSDSFTAIRGPHAFKVGLRGSLKVFNEPLLSAFTRGSLDFNGVFTSQVGVGGTGSSVADFLTGVANSSRLGNAANHKNVGHDIEWYVQDKWRATPKLTITSGVRYQYIPPNWEARDLMSNVLFGPGFTNAQVVVPNGQSDAVFAFMKDTLLPFIPVRRAPELDRGLVHNTYKNFAPRLGIAYQLGPRTVLRTGYGIFFGFPEVVSGANLANNVPSQQGVTQSSNAVDATLFIDKSVFGPQPFNRALTNPSFLSIRDPHMPPELTQMYNLSIGHEFAPNWLAEIGFIGNRSSRVAISTQINDAIPALPSDTSAVQSRRRVSTVLGVLPYLAPQGFSNYNALTLNVEKRFSAGLSLLANYTWSRALGVAPAVTNGINGTPVQNPVDLKREYGPLEYDVMKRMNISYTYELPFGKGKPYLSNASGALNHVAGGWQINGITTFQGGFPITPVLGFSLGKTDTPSRPNAVGDPTKTSRQPHDWISQAAFAVASNAEIAAGNFFGNAGWGCIRAPGLTNFDVSIFKSFVAREDIRFQFRTEFFNFTNTPFFGRPGSVGTNFNAPTFGRVTLAGDPRVVQFGLKMIF